MIFALLGLISFSQAYLGLLTDGDILSENKYRAGIESQIVLNENDGINLAGHFDIGLNDSTGLLIAAGGGATDLVGSLEFKYVPFPDFEDQPAIGFIFGTTFASEDSENFTFLSLKAFASKKFETDIGSVSPYGGLALNLSLDSEINDDPMHLIGGAKWKHPTWTNTHLFAELGVDVSDAFNYITVYLTYDFDKGVNPVDQIRSSY